MLVNHSLGGEKNLEGKRRVCVPLNRNQILMYLGPDVLLVCLLNSIVNRLQHCISYLSTPMLLSVSVGFVNTVSLRLLHSVSLARILLHLLNVALLHWTLLRFPLKKAGSFNWTILLCNLRRSAQFSFNFLFRSHI